MKLGFKLGNITIEDKIKLENIEVNVQYTAEELVTEYDLFKRALKEIPEIVADLGTGAMAFRDMEQAFDGLSKATNAEDATEESKTTASNIVLTAINKIREAIVEDNKAV
jgi:hypothetical protein